MRKVQDRKWEQLLWKLDREHRLSAGEWKDLLEAESSYGEAVGIAVV